MLHQCSTCRGSGCRIRNLHLLTAGPEQPAHQAEHQQLAQGAACAQERQAPLQTRLQRGLNHQQQQLLHTTSHQRHQQWHPWTVPSASSSRGWHTTAYPAPSSLQWQRFYGRPCSDSLEEDVYSTGAAAMHTSTLAMADNPPRSSSPQPAGVPAVSDEDVAAAEGTSEAARRRRRGTTESRAMLRRTTVSAVISQCCCCLTLCSLQLHWVAMLGVMQIVLPLCCRTAFWCMHRHSAAVSRTH